MALLDPSVEEIQAENRVINKDPRAMTESEIMEADTMEAPQSDTSGDCYDESFAKSMQHFTDLTQWIFNNIIEASGLAVSEKIIALTSAI